MAVWIGRPLMRGSGERLPFLLVDWNAELNGYAIKASPQDLGIEMCRTLLLNLGAGAVESRKEILFRTRDAILTTPSAEKSDNGGFPVDEGPVDIEGHGIEIGEA